MDRALFDAVQQKAFAFAPGNEKPGKPAGRSQVKLGNQNADIQTSATRFRPFPFLRRNQH
jgi:hypothetical protein